nr:MAG TPA: hypothetical protein [Caudoviricetes sp.]
MITLSAMITFSTVPQKRQQGADGLIVTVPSVLVSMSTALPGNNPASPLICFGRVIEPFLQILFDVFIIDLLFNIYCLILPILTLHLHGLVTVPVGGSCIKVSGLYPLKSSLYCSDKAV